MSAEDLALHLESAGQPAAAAVVRSEVAGYALLVDRARFADKLADALGDDVTRRSIAAGDTTVIVIVDGLADRAAERLERITRKLVGDPPA